MGSVRVAIVNSIVIHHVFSCRTGAVVRFPNVAERMLSATSVGDGGLAKVTSVNRNIVLMWILPGLLLSHRLPPEKRLHQMES